MEISKKEMFKIYITCFILYVIVTLSNQVGKIFAIGGLAIIIGIVWMFLTVTIYFAFLRKNNNHISQIIYSVINAIIGGVVMSAYYTLENVQPYLPLLTILIFGGFIFINYWLMNVVKNKTGFVKINLIIASIVLITSLLLWLDKEYSLGSSLTFLSIVYICFSVALYRVVKKRLRATKIIPYTSLFMFGGILLIVITVITDGDSLDFFDGSWVDDTKYRKRKLRE